MDDVSTYYCKGMCLLLLVWAANVSAAQLDSRVSDIRNTKHNFSADVTPILPGGGVREVQAVNESEICVFCHTPHGGQASATGPIWNRQLSGATYIPYSSTSLDATVGQPGGSSRLCLSCHDGTMAVGAVNVIRGRSTDRDASTAEVELTGVDAAGAMPVGEGEASGYTRRLGVDLTNDHPISMTYDTALALADGEMRDPSDPAQAATVSSRVAGAPAPLIPLEDGQVQCASCHDPHIRDTDPNNTVSIKFLRLNRFQKNDGPVEGAAVFDSTNDIICMACHDKAGWADSAHAHRGVADEVYTDTAANQREFAIGAQVWESSCLACHDTHTVQGARRLTRGGVDSFGQAAIEETCYACHSMDGGVLQQQGTVDFQVPNIKSDFALPYRMPIRTTDQQRGHEIHGIGTSDSLLEGDQRGKDFVEAPSLMGNGNRHAECTDCHNPHRVIKNRQFNSDPSSADAAGTHYHNEADEVTIHNNIASGVLRGISGVEPVYFSRAFGADPGSFELKKGNPPIMGSTDVSSSYVTREYQVCFKCHSNYAFGSTPPMLGASTPPFTFPADMVQYTNQAMEFQAPVMHQGEGQFLGVDGGAHSDFDENNHRSWHPVMGPTGRTTTVRGGSGIMGPASKDIFVAPWNVVGAMGTQTMYCSDCHGSSTAPSTVVPDGGEDGRVWGPHGSENPFLLKGTWDRLSGSTGATNTGNTLCFKCHNYDNYGNPNIYDSDPGVGANNRSGFSMASPREDQCVSNQDYNLHTGHARSLMTFFGQGFRCALCHIAIPHGWKNKAFLVNLNDVGPEAGLPAGSSVPDLGAGPGYTRAPYYSEARLKINPLMGFARSGEWQAANCGNGGAGGADNGQLWMVNNCVNIP